MALQVSHVILAWVISGRGWLGVSVLLGVSCTLGSCSSYTVFTKRYVAVCVAPSPVLPKDTRVQPSQLSVATHHMDLCFQMGTLTVLLNNARQLTVENS